uniref:COX assembly mitochondrial protein n=1 Tax=Amphimedon queenslandica TaxID=400682 RepID=A0A1X7SE97_AMPQE
MARDLLGRTAKDREEQKQVNITALHFCQEERDKLQRCIRGTWFGQCSKEHKEFWDCLTRVCNIN